MKRSILLFIITISMFILTGCGISDNTVNKAKSAQNLYKTAESAFLDKKAKFDNFKKSKDFKKFRNYAKSEKWNNEFVVARSYLDQAKQVNDSLTKLLKEDDSDKESIVTRKSIDLQRKVMEASKHYNSVKKRISFLTKVMKDAPVIHKNAVESESKINAIYSKLAEHFETVKKDYPEKSSDLDKKLIAIKKIKDDSSNLLTIIQKEFAKKENNRDYASLGDSGTKITMNLKKIQDMDKTFRKKTAELYKSYSKILKDMKVDTYVVIARVSWDNYYDYPTEHTYKYSPKLVDEKTAEYLDKLTVDTIATYKKSWGEWNKKIFIPKYIWDKINISFSSSWPNGDDEAEYYIDNVIYKFYHKYIIIENDKSRKTDWVEVSENVFYANEANLGMEIVSKPYGFYESEKIKTAAPIGMSTVGNPKYGQWKTETNSSTTSHTHTFWHYYGQYSFYRDLLGPNHYYSHHDYDDYRTYRRSNRSYYGSKNQYGTWGSRTHKSRTFSSRYVKRHYSSGRRSSISRSARTSRSSGGRSRGRGPGGGGK